MEESKRFYFWKQSNIRSKKTIIIIAIVLILLLLAAGGGAGYYFLIYKPEQERQVQRERAKADRRNKIAAVQKFYMESLAGGSIDNTIALMEQIYRSKEKLLVSGFDAKTIACDTKNCTMSYELHEGRIFNVVDIEMWGEKYPPSFSGTTLDYSGIISYMDTHPLLKAWQEKKSVNLPFCTDVLSYINTWNSLVNENLKIVLNGFPASTVITSEDTLKDAVNSFGMMFATWTLKLSGPKNMIAASLALQKQHFANAFIIKSVVIDEKSMLVTGGLACKKGN